VDLSFYFHNSKVATKQNYDKIMKYFVVLNLLKTQNNRSGKESLLGFIF